MKKYFKSTLLFAAVGILFSSCSNLSKISFAKRHYRSGYYVEFGSKPHTSPAIAITPKITSKPRQQPAYPVIETKPQVPTLVNTSKTLSEKINPAPKISVLRKDVQKKDENMSSSLPSPKISAQSSIVQSHENSEGGEARVEAHVDVPFVVIVLCAIFIPPLGVGLMYGVNSYFWIDLILTLLFFFPGMIFALIVVLM